MRQADPARERNVIEDHEGAQARICFGWIVEAVNHRNAVGQAVAKCHGLERPLVDRQVHRAFGLFAIFGEEGIDDTVFDHHAVIEHRHVGHAAVAVARIDVGSEKPVLLGAGFRSNAARHEPAVARGDTRHRPVGLEFIDEHAHRHAGLAALAVWHVGNILAAAKASGEQPVDQLWRFVVRQMGEELAFEPPRQIGTRLRRSDVELGEFLLLFRHFPALTL